MRIALTLRAVCGLSTEEIAAAFVVPEPTMAQRLVRAKRKIRQAGIPLTVPGPDALAERLNAVLRVVYLVFTQGHRAAGAADAGLIRADLCDQAIGLARQLRLVLPGEPEVTGLLALLLLTDARRAARTRPDGSLVLLADQDRIALGRGGDRRGGAARRVRAPVGAARALSAACGDRGLPLHGAVGAARRTGARSRRSTASWRGTSRRRWSWRIRRWPSPWPRVRSPGSRSWTGWPSEGRLERWPQLHIARAELLRRLGRRDEATAAYELALAAGLAGRRARLHHRANGGNGSVAEPWVQSKYGRSCESADGTGDLRIVVAGAGFAGLTALSELARLRRQAPLACRVSACSVTLVDRNAYSTFQPLLYQVATAGLTAADVAYPAWTAVRRAGAHFRKGEITGLDTDRRQLLLRDGSVLGYDYLILATGVSAAFFGVTGAAEHALSMYTRRDAIILRDQLMAELERRSAEGDTRDLNITVVGGGATGVELAGTLAELRNIAAARIVPRDRPGQDPRPADRARAGADSSVRRAAREYAKAELLERGVEVRLRTEIAEVAKDHVRIADRKRAGHGGDETGGEALPSDVTVWAAGIVAPRWIGKLGLPAGRGGPAAHRHRT